LPKEGTYRAAFPEVQKFIANTFDDLVMLKCPSTTAACIMCKRDKWSGYEWLRVFVAVDVRDEKC
jgi:hypothetical protein